ncbi:site-2 protease family protein [Cellulomonas cellasea]|uniref:Zinc metalloprotease n=1 Tax=Cellulomonas cellasea TaxID=43670 RepID=A0A7W4UEH4_9CELL|nr:site-2 protease family protein [Cellulomonas cellasea]MBB2922098.1 Zn-dependent protease [Cellulomonas cellasea]
MSSAERRQGTRGWVVGRAAGAPVVVTPTWLLTAVVLTAVFAPTIQARAPGLGALTWVVAGAFVVMLFVSVFVHELAHGFVARARGQVVREFALTLWGGHTAFGGAAPTPATSALVAVVGPLANVVIAAACWAVGQALPSSSLLGMLLYAGAVTNGFVALFNLVPGLPLDGGRVLEALVWRVTGDRHAGTVAAGWVGRFVAVGVLVWALALPLLEGTRPSLFTVGWAGLVGAFLWSGASGAVREGRQGRVLDLVTVESVGLPATVVPAGASLADADRARSTAGVDDVVLVSAEGHPEAYVDRAAAAGVPSEQRASTPVAAVAVVLPAGAVVDGTLRGAELVGAVGHATRLSPVMAVVTDGRVTALVRATDVVAALRHVGPGTSARS